MKKLNECVGKIVKGVNTTSDVNIHSIKQQAKKFGNDVSDEGDPLYNISEYFKYLKENISEDVNNLLENEKRTEQILSNSKFQNWFKGSKVVDSKGKPLICFHGTKVTFDKFYPLSHFGTVRASENFVGKTEYAFNSWMDRKDNITPVYLSIKNPLEIKDEDNYAPDLGFDMYYQGFITYDELLDVYDNTRYGKNLNDEIQNIISKFNFDLDKKRPNFATFLDHAGYKINTKKFITIFKNKGYDGMYYKNTSEDFGSISWIIFDSNQVWPIFKNEPDKNINEDIADYKHLIKNDWEYPEELMLWLMSNKFKKIGKGSFSTVFKQENSNIVLKVIGTGTWNQEDEMFDKWYDFCKQNKSKFLPKFGSIKNFNTDGKKYQLVFTENLSKMPQSKLFSTIAIGNLIKHFYSDDEITEEQFNKIVRVVDDKEDIPEIKNMLPVLKQISKTFNKNNLDIQLSNFMMRGNTIVINDIIGQKKKGW